MSHSNDTALVNTAANTALDIERMTQAGQMADRAAARGVFADYASRKAHNTLRTHAACLARFADFLAYVQVIAPDQVAKRAAALGSDPNAWQGVTWGLIEGFRNWLVNEGEAIATVNLRLSVVKTYARLAMKAGTITPEAQRLIASVSGYAAKEGKRINEGRATPRVGSKKAEHNRLTLTQAESLKAQPNTPQGRRDALLMCLLLDHGLRCGEIAGLKVSDFDLTAGVMTFYRPKVGKTQTHELTADTLAALRAWYNFGDVPIMQDSPLLRASRKGGTLGAAGMSEQAITGRVQALGADRLGIANLSAHDCRHYWATYWAGRVDKLKRGLFTLQEAGGWASLTMPRRYVDTAAIANEGMA